MSVEQNKALARRFFDEVCNGRNRAAANEIFTADHQYHDPGAPGIPNGPEGMVQLAATYYTAFGDARWTVHDVIATDDTAAVRWSGAGTHTAELNGIPATHKRASVTGLFFCKIRGGKIAESYNQWDTLGLLQQLGVVPQLAAK